MLTTSIRKWSQSLEQGYTCAKRTSQCKEKIPATHTLETTEQRDRYITIGRF
jgi:hypothetical protein